MKKYEKIYLRVLCIGIIAVFCTLLFAGCGKEGSTTAELADPFIEIEGMEEQGLVYNKQSKTVYLMLRTSSPGGYSYGYMSEYVLNGHNCEYRDDKIVEVIPNYQIVDNKIVEIEPTYKEVKEIIQKESVDDKWNTLTEEEKKALLEDK